MDLPTPPPQPGTSIDCRPISQMLGRIGDKWTIMTITMLLDGPRRFNELRRLIGGISQQMLTRTLRALENDGLVSRKVYPTIPPQVEYSLTALGRSLAEPLTQLTRWVLSNMSEIERNRREATTDTAR
ncbi:DNA-binding HxlR family transcriptional regulator [Rhizobium sp. BK196]|jgi:DNA-binding HxlR family transcriptional regulator|uniref:winged helix-turn-helix transcriptional regulator n=1 Tax=Rhizobium sp. BK196 TaxID=2587073 RepID=UPI00161216BB|nr:helix-turn-helix domain-containing protein [Rhizobium sp. BK196]MBB3308487.1 DNA-binding HxlR family transcriptional regulator [Rhizobium sp. BK196]